jgi:hypothetical protein
MQMNHVSISPMWAVHEVERAEKIMRNDFPAVRQAVISVAVRLSQREVSPRDGVSALLAHVRRTLEKRQRMAERVTWAAH